VIAVDTNVLIYAHRSETPKHKLALAKIRQLAEGRSRWAIPIFCLGEFVRVMTHRRIFTPPFTLDEALSSISHLRQAPTLEVILPSENFLTLFEAALREGDARGNLAFDAQIVALCREAGVTTLVSDDRDFARFDDFHVERL
jgi:uncharacterized protein